MPEDYVPRLEWELYCRSVNGALKEIKAAQLLTNKALIDLTKAISNRWSKSQVLLVTVLSATITGLLVAYLSLLSKH